MSIKNIPSIENIQINNEQIKKAISNDDIDRLFFTAVLPKFQLEQLKGHTQLLKYKLFQYFLDYLQNWNKKISQTEKKLNIRTQKYCSQFIFSQLKRIVVSNKKNIQKALNRLYNWFQMNNKSNKLQNYFMPSNKKAKKQQDQFQIRKNFKYNTTLQLNSYKRKFLLPSPELQNNFVDGSFITTPKVTLKTKDYDKIDKAKSYKMKQLQLRRVRELQQIQGKQIECKNKRTRFQEQSIKNYYGGNFNTTIRFLKTQIGKRNKNTQFNEIKQSRVKSSLKLFKNYYLRQDKKQNVFIPQNIGGAHLIKNPFQVKIRGKAWNKRKIN